MSHSHPPSEELFAYRDGELDVERRGLIEAHVLSCTACQARIDALSDAEGVLREQSGEPEAAYLDRLTDSVMARVAKEPAPGGAAGAPAVRRERAARRRNFEDEPGGRAPGLPWHAIVGTVAAAAAVVVVVALFVRSPGGWRASSTIAQAPPPAESETGRSAEPPPMEEETGPLDGAATEAAERDEAVLGSPAAPSGDDLLAQAGADANERTDTVLGDRAADPSSGRARTGAIRTESAGEALPEAAALRLAAEKKAADAPAKVTGGLAPTRQEASRADESGGPTYGEVVARHGLPPLYDPLRVRSEALLSAEPELRVLYQTGGAGADSARARIYLAEAARARAGEDLDADTFDTIVHHYRRALQLARDPATWRVARQRLDDFVARSAPNR